MYENALVVAFPSFNEGFGLPIIESFDRGALCLAADIPVLREVGGDYCKYFSLENVDGFIEQVQFYINNPKEYMKDKEKIKLYQRFTWDECAKLMISELEKML